MPSKLVPKFSNSFSISWSKEVVTIRFYHEVPDRELEAIETIMMPREMFGDVQALKLKEKRGEIKKEEVRYIG